MRLPFLIAAVISALLAGAACAQNGNSIEQKLKTIIIPQVVLENAAFPEAIEYLKQRAAELDPAKKGFNIVIDVPADSPALQKGITLELREIPVGAALDYATSLAGLRYKTDKFAVVIYAPPAPPTKGD